MVPWFWLSRPKAVKDRQTGLVSGLVMDLIIGAKIILKVNRRTARIDPEPVGDRGEAGGQIKIEDQFKIVDPIKIVDLIQIEGHSVERAGLLVRAGWASQGRADHRSSR